MLFIYGWRKRMIGVSEVFLYNCPYCDETNTTTVAFFSKYYHLFFVPVAPFAKEAYASCSHCGAGRNDSRLGPELEQQVKEIAPNYSHPFYLYTLIILAGLLILLVIFVAPK
jgi:hypothetical protein